MVLIKQMQPPPPVVLIAIVFFVMLIGAGVAYYFLVYRSYANIENCKFAITSIQDVKLMDNILVDNNGNVVIFDPTSMLVQSAMNADLKVPLKFILNVNIHNPNSAAARLPEFLWKVRTGEEDITEINKYDREITISSGDSEDIALDVEIDLANLTNISIPNIPESALNIVKSFQTDASTPTDNSQPQTVLEIKPTIYVGDIPLEMKDYIVVKGI